MFQINHPVTLEFSRLHFRAAAARIEAEALSDEREYDYLMSSDLPADFEVLDALANSVSARCNDRINLLAAVSGYHYAKPKAKIVYRIFGKERS
jgi:hypothetical protein